MKAQAPYPDQARFLARVCGQLGLQFKDLDNGNGYLFQVGNGHAQFVSGDGRICAWPLNTASAHDVSRDKAHTNAVLANAGISTIPSALYFITGTHAKLRPPGGELPDAIHAIGQAAGPVFCKPNAGSHGDLAEIVPDVPAFLAYVERARQRYDAILLQPIVEGDEYRVFCLDGEAVFAIQRANFSLIGDGASDLRILLTREGARLSGSGVSSRDVDTTLEYLGSQNLPSHHVPAAGVRIELPGRRNLSAGSDVQTFTTDVPPTLAVLAVRAAQAVGLRVAGVDIFDTSPKRDLSQLVIIEVNGNPAIASLSRIGRDDVIDGIWRKVLQTWFAEAGAP
jgi:glutathione synthase/RimK-type ligase-like ATP-grasp enzyme